LKNFKSLLLLKLPYCTHPDSLSRDEDFRTISTFRPIPSLALASLCAFLDKYKTYDYSLKAIDINIEAYTTPEVPIDASIYLGLLTNYIKNNEYDVLALSAMFVFTTKWVDTAVEHSRKYRPEAKIVIGGGYPTLFPERCLKENGVDDVVIGEGESTLLHILNKYNNYKDIEFEKRFPFQGYASKNTKDEVVVVPRTHSLDLENLPYPAWNYLNVKKYFKNSGDKKLPIEASRGCPYSCNYCCTYLAWGKSVRYKTVENMINEIEEQEDRYNNPTICFIDDNMSFSKKWITQFLTQLISKNLSLDASASNFCVKHLDEEVVDLLVKAGVKEFGIAVESGSPQMQKHIRKNVNFDKVREVVKIMKAKNLHVHVCWMLGFPNETLQQINSTIDFARELKAHSNQFMTVLPYPGTKLFEDAKSNNLLISPDDDLDKYDNRKCDYLKSDEWNSNQLQEIGYDANIELNFLNNPCLDTAEGRDSILRRFEDLLLTLPEHIILHICVGYINKLKNNSVNYEKHYKTAERLFKNQPLYNTFIKYLSWDFNIVNDFVEYLKANNKEIGYPFLKRA
jgi:radical SAM superfamily enzyme YgiQ (UPF0313 family)